MSSPTSSTDRIEKKVQLRAPIARVWRAISDSEQFGRWFGVRFEGPFVAGKTVAGTIRATEVDPEVAKAQEPYSGTPFEIVVEQMETERRLSFKWHPFPEEGVDLANEPMTTVTFLLEAQGDGTLLTVTESGFDALPPARRKTAFEMNEGGWEAQTRLVAKFLELHAA